MKKLIATLLCSCMLLSCATLVACSDNSKKDNNTSKTEKEDDEDKEDITETEDATDNSSTISTDTKGAKLYSEFVTRLEKSDDISAIATELATEDIAGYDCGTMPVSEGLLNGFTDEITGFSEGIMFSPYIGSIPFVAYIFKSDDPAALKDTLLSQADPRWNICTEADETFCEVNGDYVFFVMLPNE